MAARRQRVPFAVLALVLLGFASAAAQAPVPERRADVLRGKIAERRERESVLTSDITSFSNRLRAVQGRVRALRERRADLTARLERLNARRRTLGMQLRSAMQQLAEARRELVRARRVLAARLVALYKRSDPDVLTVVLEADGFADLLERAQFVERIGRQDAETIARVRAARTRAAVRSTRLRGLERAAARAVRETASRQADLLAVERETVSTQQELEQAREGRAALLRRVRRSRRSLEGDLQAVQSEVRARLVAAQRRSVALPPAVAGPVRRGSGAFIWPVNGPVTSPFGPRWGRLHAGVDIPAAAGTPIRAAAGGRVVIAGWTGGYGNYTCIQHDAATSTCYAHQLSIGVRSGQSVAQAGVIGSVGNTGNSFGNHLHFEVRMNGTPVDPISYL